MRIVLILLLTSLSVAFGAPSLVVSNLTIQGQLTGYEQATNDVLATARASDNVTSNALLSAVTGREPNGTNDIFYEGLTLATGDLRLSEANSSIFSAGNLSGQLRFKDSAGNTRAYLEMSGGNIEATGGFSTGGGSRFFSATGLDMVAGDTISWRDAAYGSQDLFLRRDAANTLAQRNGTAPQTNRLFGTYVDASNYSYFQWARNNVGTYFENLAAGSGVAGSFIFNGGNVGIGTVAPNALLDVTTTSTASFPLLVRGDIDANGAYSGISFGFSEGNGSYEKARIMVRGTSGFVQPEMHFLLDNTADNSNADINDSKLSILPSGNVGIGTTTPGTTLSVNGTFSVTNSAYVRTNIAQFDVSIADFVLGTRYTNSNRRSFVAASFQLAAAAAGTAAVALNVEQSGVTNKLTISSGPLASLVGVQTLGLPVGPSAFFYFSDATSGSGAVASIVAGTSSQTFW